VHPDGDLQSGPLLPRSAYVAVPDEPAVALAIYTLDQGAELILVRDYDSALDSNSIRIEFNDEDIGALDPANSAVLAIEIAVTPPGLTQSTPPGQSLATKVAVGLPFSTTGFSVCGTVWVSPVGPAGTGLAR
jgi:hypothetical protein